MAIPVYMFAGFLESGKTSFIASVLQDPGFTRDESTLIIQCEEGETEYEPDMLKKTHSVVECIEDEDEYNGDTLRAFVRKHHPDRVIVEMNGMWDLDAAIERTPKVLLIAPPVILPEIADGPLGRMIHDGHRQSLLFAPEYARVAQAHRIDFLDAAQYAVADPADCVHIGAASHLALGEAAAAKVREMFAE